MTTQIIDLSQIGPSGGLRFGAQQVGAVHYMGERLWPFDPDPLRGAGPNFFATDDFFAADGVTPAVAGDQVSLVIDDVRGLEVGPELYFGTALPRDVENPGIGGLGLASVEVGKVYLIDLTYGPNTGTTSATYRVNGSAGGLTTLSGVSAGEVGRRRQIARALATGALSINPDNTGVDFTVTAASVREVFNWPAYQTAAASRPQAGFGPLNIRNRLPSTDFLVSAGWAMSAGAIVPKADDFFLIRQSLSTTTHAVEASLLIMPGETVRFSCEARFAGEENLIVASDSIGAATFNLNTGVAGGGGLTSPFMQNLGGGIYRCEVTITNNTSAIRNLRIGQRANTAFTGNGVSGVDVRYAQLEPGTVRTAFQNRPSPQPNIIEAGVPSVPFLSFNGSSHALLSQIANGGTVGVAIFGRYGSFYLPAVNFSAPSVLSMGPLHITDDGVIIPGSPANLLLALGRVMWSNRFILVAPPVITKPNLSAVERMRLLRQYARRGAGGWLTLEGPNIAPNSGFDTDVAGYVGVLGTPVWDAGRIRINNTVGSSPSARFRTNAFLAKPNTLYRVRVDLVTLLGDATSATFRIGDASLNLNNPNASQALSIGSNDFFIIGSGTAMGTFGCIQGGGAADGPGGAIFDNLIINEMLPEPIV